MAQIISSHNNNILKNEDVQQDPCNWNPPESCPVQGECGKKGIIYQAKVIKANGDTLQLQLFILQQGLNEHITIIRSESCCFITWMYFEL